MIFSRQKMRFESARWARRFLILQCGLLAVDALAGRTAVAPDFQNKRVVLSTAGGSLVIRLAYDGRCVLDQVVVGGREAIASDPGACSGIQVGGHWFTTGGGIPTPRVEVASNSVAVTDIRFGGGGIEVSENWRLTAKGDEIVWQIDRAYHSGGALDDTDFPGWRFRDVSTWTGALLGTGGVAWPRLFDAPNASYGVHTGSAVFWTEHRPLCLRIAAQSLSGGCVALRFSREPSGVFSLHCSVTESERAPKRGLSRFRRDRQDIWRPFAAKPGVVSAEIELSAPSYEKNLGRGIFVGLDGAACGEICNTIARVGVVDEQIIGSNSYYSDVAVLHEPWLAQLGMAIDDPNYDRALGETLDFQRQNAIGPDGRVKSRWAGQRGDETPGTYDHFGFYEAQWGCLMDSQPSWVINVAELFDLTGDRLWLRRQKAACERALEFLLRRRADGDGLVEMMSGSQRNARASDWLDVVWASGENALVNAQMYCALTEWARLEEFLGDPARGAHYRAAAAKLKRRFNQTIGEGGFWDPQNQWYDYWRDQDHSIHGTNLVVPVNFSAIGYGLCDDPSRRAAILDRIESLMRREQLFFWPLCFFSYAPGEAHPSQYPFPAYENGDIFLAWGELGTRAYAWENPAIALQYVKNVLAQYARDGLAFQRWRRKGQTGAGSDVLANNASAIVGLYRNLYGIQPKHDRLYLEPHLTPDLNGTALNYWLRGQRYRITLRMHDYAIGAGGFTVRCRTPFAASIRPGALECFTGPNSACALAIAAPAARDFELNFGAALEAGQGERRWTERCPEIGAAARHLISELAPNALYQLSRNGAHPERLRSDAAGRIRFDFTFSGPAAESFALDRASP